MIIWFYVGIGALLWSLAEVVSGRAWIHREIIRDEEPTLFWFVVMFWALLGMSCFVPSFCF